MALLKKSGENKLTLSNKIFNKISISHMCIMEWVFFFKDKVECWASSMEWMRKVAIWDTSLWVILANANRNYCHCPRSLRFALDIRAPCVMGTWGNGHLWISSLHQSGHVLGRVKPSIRMVAQLLSHLQQWQGSLHRRCCRLRSAPKCLCKAVF